MRRFFPVPFQSVSRNYLVPFAAALSLALWSLGAAPRDIPAGELPADVLALLNQYVEALQTSASLDEAAGRVAAIGGGGIVNSGGTIDTDVLRYGLKKDFENAKFYRLPVQVTRVSMSSGERDGHGSTLIQGTRYKIWIAKKSGVAGLPAPVPIIKPGSGEPKIVTVIGSL